MKPILELSENGDPCGSGYTASESQDGGDTWFYRGDLGARSRAWWRNYARRGNYKLREVRSVYKFRTMPALAVIGPHHKDGCKTTYAYFSGKGYDRVRVCSCGAEDHTPNSNS